MILELVDHFVTGLGGRRLGRLPYWNPTDDSGRLSVGRWEIDAPQGLVKINAYEQRSGVDWPDCPCEGDTYRNKFAASLWVIQSKEGGQRLEKILSLTDGFVEANPENLEKYLGLFRT